VFLVGGEKKRKRKGYRGPVSLEHLNQKKQRKKENKEGESRKTKAEGEREKKDTERKKIGQ